jgi:hypothetical protein
MVSNSKLCLVLLVPFVTLIHASGVARADGPDEPQGPPILITPTPVYPAPLSQTTQTTYVPQSVALSGPEEIKDYDETRPAPLGYTAVLRPRKHLIVGGAVTFAVPYSMCLLTAAIGADDAKYSGKNEVASLWIPVAGPFIQLGQTNSATAQVFLVGLGGAQLAGAIMLYYGMTTKQRVFVRNDLVGNVMITPMAGQGNTGLSLSGSF